MRAPGKQDARIRRAVMAWTDTHYLLVFLVVLACVNYLTVVVMDKVKSYESPKEGFEDKETQDMSVYTWITDPSAIYDEFYAGVYDQLTNQISRTKAKVVLLNTLWNKSSFGGPEKWSVLDAGCGTGWAAATFAKMNAGRVVGLDFSPAMLQYAETKVQPQFKLSDKQSSALRWRKDTLINPSACAAGEFTHIVCFYFTFYYLPNPEEFFRMCNLWIRPGGSLIVEVVNKYKFDPILESASPWLGFSIQKYSTERIKQSKVAFDKFEYEARFELTDPKGEFYETFRFKNNHVRRQKHVFQMPKIEEIVAMGKRAGWKYRGYQDMNALGFEYGYLLEFVKA